MHGDAAFAGQGILAETLNMSGVEGYTVGGAVHIIVNNLIGFTTMPRDSNLRDFRSDLAKRLPIPIFHVNAEDPEAVVRVGRMALDYRYEFGTTVIVDLIGFRRHGHSEVDDPTITQPLRYRKIQDHPPIWQKYAEKIGRRCEANGGPGARGFGRGAETRARAREKPADARRCRNIGDAYKGGKWKASNTRSRLAFRSRR